MGGFIPDAPEESDDRDPATEVGDLLHQVNRRIRHAAGAARGPGGLTFAQMRALRTLGGRDEMRMSELADALGIVRRSATSVVDELEHLGLAVRSDDPTDRRSVRVGLSPAGRRAMAAARRRRRSAATAVLGRLDATELETLRVLLRRLVAD